MKINGNTVEFEGTDTVILLRDGSLTVNATNETAKRMKDCDWVYMGDLKGIAERFNKTPQIECSDCEKGNMEESDLDGELVYKCDSCGFWIGKDIFDDGQ